MTSDWYIDNKRDAHQLLWELIRKSGNNKTRAAKALGISRQLLNYYVNQTQQLSDEFIRKIKPVVLTAFAVINAPKKMKHVYPER